MGRYLEVLLGSVTWLTHITCHPLFTETICERQRARLSWAVTHLARLAQALGSCELSNSQQHPLGSSITAESSSAGSHTTLGSSSVFQPDSYGILYSPEHHACPAPKHSWCWTSPEQHFGISEGTQALLSEF